MQLDAYLARIGFEGAPRPDLETLTAVHRQHLLAIPYENIDVQLQRRCDLDVERIYRKLVEQGRGGWCYEMNGLLCWALAEIGFDVTRVNGAVGRRERGDDAVGNHLVLLVHLDETWVADVGFGDGVIDPIPLREADIEQRGFRYRLERIDDTFWRFHNHEYGGAPDFDFSTRPADEKLFSSKCELLQTSGESPFVTSLVCQRFVDGGYEIQRGLCAGRISPDGADSWLLHDAGELVERLRTAFGLDVPDAGSLWPRLVERHAEWLDEGRRAPIRPASARS